MSINTISNNSRNLESMIYKRKPIIIPKDRLPQRPWEENYNSDGKYNIVAMNRDGNKAKIQEMAKLISQSKTADTKDEKKIKVVSTAAKAEENGEDEEHNTSDESTLTDIVGILTKEGLYRCTGSKLIKPNPYLVAMDLLGVDFEKDGNAIKKGAETGEIGDFAGDYKNYFKGMWNRADSVINAAREGFNLPANVISIGLQNCLQTAGVGLSKVFGKDITAFLGSGVSTVGTAFNAMGDIAEDSVKGTIDFYKNLFTGDFDGVGDSVTDIYNGVKDSVVDVATAVGTFATDGADAVVDTAKKMASVAEDAWNGVSDVAGDVGNAIADAAGDVGDAIKDGWDEVEDFFDSIF